MQIVEAARTPLEQRDQHTVGRGACRRLSRRTGWNPARNQVGCVGPLDPVDRIEHGKVQDRERPRGLGWRGPAGADGLQRGRVPVCDDVCKHQGRAAHHEGDGDEDTCDPGCSHDCSFQAHTGNTGKTRRRIDAADRPRHSCVAACWKAVQRGGSIVPPAFVPDGVQNYRRLWEVASSCRARGLIMHVRCSSGTSRAGSMPIPRRPLPRAAKMRPPWIEV